MSLSAKQYRQYMLSVLLSTGKPVGKDTILEQLKCSEPTFNRDLRDIRETHQADIRYSKANHQFQLVDSGSLTPKLVRHMREALNVHESSMPQEPMSGVVLDKDGKKAVSLSLHFSVIRRIASCGHRLGLNRSEVMERLVTEFIDEFEAQYSGQNGK